MGKIFDKFSSSKVETDKIWDGTSRNNGLPTRFGGVLIDKTNVGLSSKTKGSSDATNVSSKEYGMSNAGGASGDGPTPGYTGSGKGVDTLNGAQGRV